MKKKILVIGCLGHIGFSLASYLKKKYDFYWTYNNTVNNSLIKELALKKKLFNVNVSDKKKIYKILKKIKIDICVYCVAVPHDKLAKENPENTIIANCLGINNFLNFKDQLNFKLIYISTGSVFQEIKSSKIKIDEKSQTSPKSLYAITKRLGELLVENSFKKNKNSTILRVSWVYGPPIITEKLDVQRGPLAYIFTKLFYNKLNSLKFSGGRDFEASFTYINDVILSLEKLIRLKSFSYPIYHLGSGKNYRLSVIEKFINKNFNKEFKMGPGFMPWSNDSVIRGPIISKHKYKLKTKYSLYNGLKEYIKFLENN